MASMKGIPLTFTASTPHQGGDPELMITYTEHMGDYGVQIVIGFNGNDAASIFLTPEEAKRFSEGVSLLAYVIEELEARK